MSMSRLRGLIQLVFTALSNGYIAGFLKGGLYMGRLKTICLPGLNCYSCPGALGSCPIGALQSVIKHRDYGFSFYVVGTLAVVGALIGRLVCGFLCPFGFVQDLLHKIPFPKKIVTFPGDRILRFLKYIVLIVFVLALPMFATNIIGQGDPWFCKWICPSGTLMGGVPQLLLNPSLREAAGALFGFKGFVLLLIVALSILIPRPFCRYLCPLGAIYALTNRLSLYRLQVVKEQCIHCGKCEKACPMAINPEKTPNHPECVRCMDCKAACPTRAIRVAGPGLNRPSAAGREGVGADGHGHGEV